MYIECNLYMYLIQLWAVRQIASENSEWNNTFSVDGRTPLEIFDHSQMVENVLKKSEEVNNILDQSEEALLNGGEDDNDVDKNGMFSMT